MTTKAANELLEPDALYYIAPFLCGAIAGVIGTIIVQPFDTIKVRMQLSDIGGRCRFFRTGNAFLKEEGFLALYKGIDAAIVRQIIFNFVRLGIYDTGQKLFNKTNPKSVFITGAVGSMAGFIAILAACPADVALVRFQADATLPEEERRNYKNVCDAFYKIIKFEGVCVLWTAIIPAAIRIVIINLSLFVTFEITKEFLMRSMGNRLLASIISSVIASIFSTFLSLPFDNAKTAMQFMAVDPETGKKPFNSSWDYVVKTLKSKGPFVFFRGYFPYWARVGPHTIISLIFLEIQKSIIAKYYKT